MFCFQIFLFSHTTMGMNTTFFPGANNSLGEDNRATNSDLEEQKFRDFAYLCPKASRDIRRMLHLQGPDGAKDLLFSIGEGSKISKVDGVYIFLNQDKAIIRDGLKHIVGSMEQILEKCLSTENALDIVSKHVEKFSDSEEFILKMKKDPGFFLLEQEMSKLSSFVSFLYKTLPYVKIRGFEEESNLKTNSNSYFNNKNREFEYSKKRLFNFQNNFFSYCNKKQFDTARPILESLKKEIHTMVKPVMEDVDKLWDILQRVMDREEKRFPYTFQKSETFDMDKKNQELYHRYGIREGHAFLKDVPEPKILKKRRKNPEHSCEEPRRLESSPKAPRNPEGKDKLLGKQSSASMHNILGSQSSLGMEISQDPKHYEQNSVHQEKETGPSQDQETPFYDGDWLIKTGFKRQKIDSFSL